MQLSKSRPAYSGRSYCQGICVALKNNPVVGTKKYYLKGGKHVRCSKCDTWMLQASMKADGRCPCCNFRPRYK